jgi:hypothetical protein
VDVGLSERYPMTAGEIVDAAWRLYRENAALFLGILAILLVPQAILNAVLPPLSPLSIFTSTYSLGALILAIEARDSGRDITVREAYSSLGVHAFVVLLLTSVVIAIIVFIGFVLFVIPGIYLLIRFAFVDPVVVLERKGVGEALVRSWTLVQGAWWRVFGIGLLVFVLLGLASGALSAALGSILPPRAAGAIGILISIVVQPIAVSVLVLLYYDVRLRREGWLGEAVEGDPPIVG